MEGRGGEEGVGTVRSGIYLQNEKKRLFLKSGYHTKYIKLK